MNKPSHMMKRHGGKTVINHMGGVFLYNRPEQVLEQYELEVKSISRGRDSYQCDTEQGPKILREYRGSKERAEFLADMLDHLDRQGRTVETIMRTKEGEPFSVNEEETKYRRIRVQNVIRKTGQICLAQ